MSFILGTKVKMSQTWKDNKVIPVTVVRAGGTTVSLRRTKDRDGYDAVQLAHAKKTREFRIAGDAAFKKGDTVEVSAFQEGDRVAVSGTSKGRGFQGVVKRHGFAGGPKTHGQKNRFRAPGSIGSTAPQRVMKGRRMAGHMGSARVTVKNLRVVGIDSEKGLLLLRGAVPGAPGGLLEIRKLEHKKK
jgi:large subunit ribosomal protein L3